MKINFEKYLEEARFLTDKQLDTVINNAKLHLMANRIKEADSDDSDDGSIYHMKPFHNNDDFMKHSHEDNDEASKPVTMPRNHHNPNGASAAKLSPKASHLRTSIKKSVQQGVKNYGFHQNLGSHNLMSNTLNRNNTKSLKIKKNPIKNSWGAFTDKDLMKFFRNHH